VDADLAGIIGRWGVHLSAAATSFSMVCASAVSRMYFNNYDASPQNIEEALRCAFERKAAPRGHDGGLMQMENNNEAYGGFRVCAYRSICNGASRRTIH
jgi:hypothetical protein